MSDLQLALIVIGVALVAAVFAFNKWQEARFRRQAEAGLKSRHPDVLLRPPAGAPAARVEPTFCDDTASRPGREATPEHAPGSISEAIDYVVMLESPEPVAGRALEDAALALLGQFRKPVKLEGYGPAGWETLDRAGRYQRTRIGMQLVDRRGSTDEQDLAAFGAAVEEAAAAAGAHATPASAEEALRTAARLDRLCDQVDIQIALHVVSRSDAFAGTRIRALAEAAGLALEDDGRFRRRDAEGHEVFSLGNGEAAQFSAESMKTLSTGAVLLELDVPRAAGGLQALAAFRGFAEQFAAGLGGLLVDDNRASLDGAAFDAITAQLLPVYDALRDQGIPAGSPLALRLFS
jgi:FtsZ-interacting cell division protein ZipA